MQQGRTGLPVAVVIGGSGGMGQSCARRLAQRHAVVLASRDVSKSEQVAVDLRREGAVAHPIACDITEPASVAAMVEQASALSPDGRVQTLAVVAGLSPSMADWDRILTVNLAGTATVVEAVLPVIASGGVAVLVSSLAGHNRAADPAMLAVLDDPLAADLPKRAAAALGRDLTTVEAYGFSKLGEIRMARRLVTRWAERGARIVSLSPGLIQTPMGALEFTKQPMKFDLLRRTPLAREGMLTEICDALEFLCSDRASFITGTDLLVDGGIASALEFDLAAPVMPQP